MPKSPFDGIVTPDKLKAAADASRSSGRSVAAVLIGDNNVPREVVAKALAQFYRTEFVAYSAELPPPPDALLATLAYELCIYYECVPLSQADGRAVVLMADPRNLVASDDIARVIGGKITFKVSTREEIRSFLDRFHKIAPPSSPSGAVPAPVGAPDYTLAPRAALSPAAVPGAEGPEELVVGEMSVVVSLVNRFLVELAGGKAQELRIALAGDETAVVLRADSEWRLFTTLPGDRRRSLVQRLKIIAGLDILQRRKPQCGRLQIRSQGSTLHLLVATVPFGDGDEEIFAKQVS